MIFDVNLQLTFLADLLIKSAIVLVVGFGVAGLARRSAAAVRHCIWSLTFLSLLVLPALSIGFPQVRFDILPGEIIELLPRSDQPLVQDGGASLHNEKPGGALITDSVRDSRNYIRTGPGAEFHPTQSNEFGQDLPPVRANLAKNRPEDYTEANVTSWPCFVWGLGFAVAFFPVLVK